VTGLSSMMTTELNATRLHLLKELVPRLARVAVLWNPDHPFHCKVVADLKTIPPPCRWTWSFFGVRTAEKRARHRLEVEFFCGLTRVGGADENPPSWLRNVARFFRIGRWQKPSVRPS